MVKFPSLDILEKTLIFYIFAQNIFFEKMSEYAQNFEKVANFE